MTTDGIYGRDNGITGLEPLKMTQLEFSGGTGEPPSLQPGRIADFQSQTVIRHPQAAFVMLTVSCRGGLHHLAFVPLDLSPSEISNLLDEGVHGELLITLPAVAGIAPDSGPATGLGSIQASVRRSLMAGRHRAERRPEQDSPNACFYA